MEMAKVTSQSNKRLLANPAKVPRYFIARRPVGSTKRPP
jgi:hypothetical protein